MTSFTDNAHGKTPVSPRRIAGRSARVPSGSRHRRLQNPDQSGKARGWRLEHCTLEMLWPRQHEAPPPNIEQFHFEIALADARREGVSAIYLRC
jgi:hypothetical protein